MKKIGLTGGIGVGKTFVADIFQKMGYAVFSADTEAKKCMQESKDLKSAVTQTFGDEMYKNGVLQKEKLANIVFNDSEKLNELNQLNELIKSCGSIPPLPLNQLNKWKVKLHKIYFGKPSSDFYIDDKNLNFKSNWIKHLKKLLNEKKTN